tara:strand:- start:468 stop:704 length:237 start_codon:yes stop_codon:yes gene_type:complete
VKTLARPQPISTIAISADRLMPSKRVKGPIIYKRDKKKIIPFLLLLFSFSIFLFLPESPQLSESICHKYNSESICNVW